MTNQHLYPTHITPREKPTITERTIIAQTRIFRIEQHQLHFTNDNRQTYECIIGQGRGAVLIAAIDADNNFLLIREYCGGRERYELAFPKGKVDSNETLEHAAVRELQEETGYGAKHIQHLKTTTVAPGYLSHQTHLMVARDLYYAPLQGDEPEPMEIFRWSLNDIPALLAREDFTEARSIAALLMLHHYPNEL